MSEYITREDACQDDPANQDGQDASVQRMKSSCCCQGQSLQMLLFRHQDQEDASRNLPRDPGLSLVAVGHAQEMADLQLHLDNVYQSGLLREGSEESSLASMRSFRQD